LAHEYGEITPRGMRTLAAFIGLSPSDRFFDLGSGVCFRSPQFPSPQRLPHLRFSRLSARCCRFDPSH
jgi:hypothetical protein